MLPRVEIAWLRPPFIGFSAFKEPVFTPSKASRTRAASAAASAPSSLATSRPGLRRADNLKVSGLWGVLI